MPGRKPALEQEEMKKMKAVIPVVMTLLLIFTVSETQLAGAGASQGASVQVSNETECAIKVVLSGRSPEEGIVDPGARVLFISTGDSGFERISAEIIPGKGLCGGGSKKEACVRSGADATGWCQPSFGFCEYLIRAQKVFTPPPPHYELKLLKSR
ncbi:MAG: hypothetical protein PHG91_09500 [Syntrophales bacterium]|nr:hypothetical protein [Syntrophales bacterium]